MVRGAGCRGALSELSLPGWTFLELGPRGGADIGAEQRGEDLELADRGGGGEAGWAAGRRGADLELGERGEDLGARRSGCDARVVTSVPSRSPKRPPPQPRSDG
jgi:hypothetical protein